MKENKKRKEEEKVKGELGFQVARESRLETLPNSIFVCFGLVFKVYCGLDWCHYKKKNLS